MPSEIREAASALLDSGVLTIRVGKDGLAQFVGLAAYAPSLDQERQP